jgi:hypothetical protein
MFKQGQDVLIETVTKYWVGTITEVGADWVRLEPAAWVADTGRYHEALRDGFGSGAEVEPVESVVVQRAAICATLPWKHGVPRTVR